MARRDLPPPSDTHPPEPIYNPASDFVILQELEQLQEVLYDSFHIPLTHWTVVDEAKVLDQMEIVHASVPGAVQKALQILEQRETLIAQAKDYADRIIQNAQQQAAHILDETGIIQQAEQQAYQIRRQVQQECEAMQNQTLAEVSQLQQNNAQEIQQLRQQAVTECQEIQEGADRYAENMLARLEQQLTEMLTVVHNGQQQIYGTAPSANPTPKPKKVPGNPPRRPPQP